MTWLMNPFRSDSGPERAPPPSTVVIFGASGDLTRRKLVPALYNLLVDHHLSRIAILGASRAPLTDETFRDRLRSGLQEHSRRPVDAGVVEKLAGLTFYEPASYDDPDAFRRIRERLERIERAHGLQANRLFYLSVPPSMFGPVIENLGRSGLADEGPGRFARVIIEKPFGTDLSSARTLNRAVHQVLDERQIFRIDHYLGKETVQNLIVFRFANGIFEPLWNSRYVDHVQITGAETLGVEDRGGYFDRAGILRDMVQNHLFQVLCLVAMEPPVSLSANSIRNEKLKVLEALRPVKAEEVEQRVVRGQYAQGIVLGGEVPGYLEERGVAEDSRTETFVGLELFIDNWRWARVPFYLRSAKRMPKKVTEIAVSFRSAPHRLFGLQMAEGIGNVLAIRIQPDEGITLTLGSKVPGQATEVAPISMEFRYASSFGLQAPEAYERLLLDALNGDGTLFIRGDEAEASWRFITPIHEVWSDRRTSPHPYRAGSWGPDAAVELLKRHGRSWRKP